MPTIIKGHQAMESTRFKLHYFPDIPFECAYSGDKAETENGPFEHIDFNAANPGCGSIAESQCALGSPDTVPGLMSAKDTRAYEAGFQKGCDEGYQAGLQQAAGKLNCLAQVAGQLENIKQDLYQRAEKDVVNLALAVGKKILDQELQTNPEVIVGVVKGALQRVSDHTRITIRINPADLETVKQAEPQLAVYFENSSGVSYEADKTIGPGGCIIETNFGEIDARLDQQFQAVAQALRAGQTSDDPK